MPMTIYRGDDVSFPYPITDWNGEAVDPSAGKVTLTAKGTKDETDPGVLQIDNDSVVDGVAIFIIPSTATAAIPAKTNYYLGFLYTDGAGLEHTVGDDTMSVVERVEDV